MIVVPVKEGENIEKFGLSVQQSQYCLFAYLAAFVKSFDLLNSFSYIRCMILDM